MRTNDDDQAFNELQPKGIFSSRTVHDSLFCHKRIFVKPLNFFLHRCMGIQDFIEIFSNKE